MGTEAIWIPLLLSAASAGTSYINSRNTANKQDNELAAQLRGDAAHQRDADAKTHELLNKTAASTDEPYKQKSLAQHIQQIQSATPMATAGLNQAGNVSSAYKKSGADAALGIGNYGTNFADNVASIDAPSQQRTQEGIDSLRTSTDLGGIKRFTEGDQRVSNMRLAAIHANPWLSALSSALGAASSISGIGGGGGGANPFGGLGSIAGKSIFAPAFNPGGIGGFIPQTGVDW